jgi:secondary thiamine-phosphate synthase enzyme
MHRETLEVRTSGRGFTEISSDIAAVVRRSGIEQGMCNVFVRHTSASLLITENADPDVLRDLETWMSGTVRDGDPGFRHTAEGPDDMSAHVRTLLAETSLTIPIVESRPALGTWQGIFLWEHRSNPHTRGLMISVT